MCRPIANSQPAHQDKNVNYPIHFTWPNNTHVAEIVICCNSFNTNKENVVYADNH